MTPQEAEDKMANLIQNFSQEAAEALLITARDTLDIVKQRVQEEGIGSDGKPLEPYSVKPLPVYYFENRVKKSTFNRIKKDKKYKKGISYFDLRVEDGKQVQHKDLTFTGDMFRQTDISQIENSEGVSTIIISGTTPDAKKKLEYLTLQQGKFLDLTDTELNKQTEALNKRIQTIIETHLK